MVKFSLQGWQITEIVVISFVIITGCSIINVNNVQEPQSSEIITPDPASFTLESAIIYSTLSELVSSADVIFIGEALSTRGIVNTARDPSNHSIPDPMYFSVGQIYRVETESYLKGEGPSNIYVIQNEGFIHLESSSPSENEIQTAKEQSDSTPLIIGRRYIMFLSYHDPEYSYDEFPIDDFLFAKGHPWRFEITDSNCVQPENGLQEVYRYFPAMPLTEFIQYFNTPAIYPELAYPAPLSPERCPVVSIDTTPYP
jgi:hypothetical protein